MEDLRGGVCGGHPVSGEGHDRVGQGVGVQRLAGQQGVHLDTGRVSGGDNLWTSVQNPDTNVWWRQLVDKRPNGNVWWTQLVTKILQRSLYLLYSKSICHRLTETGS